MRYVMIYFVIFIGESTDGNLGIQTRASLEGRIKKLEIVASGGVIPKKAGQGKKLEKYETNANKGTYNQSNDVELTSGKK